MKLSKDSPIIKHNVHQWEWKSAEENATRVAICVACRKGSDDALYFDIIAELEYEEYLEIKNELIPTFGHNKVWTIGGLELGFLYPLQYLKLHSEPIGSEFTISVDFTEDGKRLLEKDRIDKKNNYMTHFYNHEDLIKL